MQARSALPVGFLVVAVVFLHNTLPLLTMLPRINVDEPWLIERAYQILVSGKPRQPMFLLDNAYLLQPGYSLLLAPWLKLTGVGLLQARLLAVLFGLATLWCVYRAGAELFGAELGVLAAAILATDSNFLGVSRFARTDGPAVLFSALALTLFLISARSGRRLPLFASGAAAGVAMLCHANCYWVVVVIAAWHIQVFERRFIRPALVAALGFAVTFGPYLAMIVLWRDDFNAQLNMFAIERVPSLNPSVILQYVAQEPERYRDWYFGLITDFSFNPILRLFQGCVAAGVVWLVATVVRGWTTGDRRRTEELLASEVLLTTFIFAAFIPNKALVYMPHLLLGFSLCAGYFLWSAARFIAMQMGARGRSAVPAFGMLAGIAVGAIAMYDAWYARMLKTELKPYGDTDRAVRLLTPPGPKYLIASPTFWLAFYDDPETKFLAYTAAAPYESVTPEGFFTKHSLFDLPQDRPFYALVDEREWKTILDDPAYKADWRATWVRYLEHSCSLKAAAMATAHGNIGLFRCWHGAEPPSLTPDYVVGGRLFRRGPAVWVGGAHDLEAWNLYRPSTTLARENGALRVSGTGGGIFGEVPVVPATPHLIDIDADALSAGDSLSVHSVSSSGSLRGSQWTPLHTHGWFPGATVVTPMDPTLRLYLFSEGATDFRVRSVALYRLENSTAQ